MFRATANPVDRCSEMDLDSVRAEPASHTVHKLRYLGPGASATTHAHPPRAAMNFGNCTPAGKTRPSAFDCPAHWKNYSELSVVFAAVSGWFLRFCFPSRRRCSSLRPFSRRFPIDSSIAVRDLDIAAVRSGISVARLRRSLISLLRSNSSTRSSSIH